MTRGDALALIFGAALIGALYARHWQPAVAAEAFEVRSSGDFIGRYPLVQNRSLPVQGRSGVSQVEVRDGRVRFRSSPCRNQVCVHTGWLAQSGEVAACLPNRVSIRLIGGQAAALDGLSY